MTDVPALARKTGYQVAKAPLHDKHGRNRYDCRQVALAGFARPLRRSSMPRIGILVVAYNAESTLRSVLHRIPEPIVEKIEEVFVFDDSSQDRTTEVGKA